MSKSRWPHALHPLPAQLVAQAVEYLRHPPDEPGRRRGARPVRFRLGGWGCRISRPYLAAGLSDALRRRTGALGGLRVGVLRGVPGGVGEAVPDPCSVLAPELRPPSSSSRSYVSSPSSRAGTGASGALILSIAMATVEPHGPPDSISRASHSWPDRECQYHTRRASACHNSRHGPSAYAGSPHMPPPPPMARATASRTSGGDASSTRSSRCVHSRRKATYPGSIQYSIHGRASTTPSWRKRCCPKATRAERIMIWVTAESSKPDTSSSQMATSKLAAE
eukprot:scaffold2951_cov99-Isochrysis_galbana.AAC.2